MTQYISSKALTAMDMNGSWEFRFEAGKSLEEAADPSFAATETMAVPACYDMMPKWLCQRGTGLYRRTFTLTQAVENAWLVIDGMGLRGEFRIDGKSLGVHPYPYALLELETGPLAAGQHTLFAALDNRFDWQTMKLARPYYDFYCFGGFYHGVKLVFDNRKLLVRTRDYRSGTIELEAVNFAQDDFAATLVFDNANEIQACFTDRHATVSVPNFQLWSPEAPHLHTVSLPLADGTVTARFGIREIKSEQGRLWLNGQPLYLKGANRHESHPTFGAATPEALMSMDIQNLKSMGGNVFRGSHYQQCQRFLELCDENGVMVWDESLGWGNHASGAVNELADADFRGQQVQQTREMVRAAMNHPSVIIFAFMNEFQSGSADGKSLADELIRVIKAEDSGRLVTFACCHHDDDISNENTDIVSINTYPGWIGSDPGTPEELKAAIKRQVDKLVGLYQQRYPGKTIIVSEMGTCGVYGQRDPAGAQWTEEFQAEYVGDVCDVVFGNPGLAGLIIWQFTDARSYHRGGSTVRTKPFAENLAGLFDAYRRPKLVVETVRQAFAAQDARQNA